jgi:hypothetical protein
MSADLRRNENLYPGETVLGETPVKPELVKQHIDLLLNRLSPKTRIVAEKALAEAQAKIAKNATLQS